MSKRLSVTDARSHFAEVLDRAAETGERTIVERRGKVLGAVVSRGDLELLERLRAFEDEEDQAALRRARREKGSIAWAVIKADLGL